MFLKKIELYGFKSFSNRKEIFLNSGITGIVGPNGSGKSNIADALRWVLGEQSSKALRGSSMRDVIFNGTQTKPQKGYCEVSLTFDNTENLLNSEYSEICVKRKMYRSGESEYLINNNSCRLKDILNFFRDTGIGKEGYSIIGQGKIDEILDNKPIHRRRVFEEAAGISKFRARKEEAEANLQKTRNNLVRIEDILSELELQLKPLEEQMRDAKHFIEISERFKILEVNILLAEYADAQNRIKEYNDELILYNREISETENELKKFGEHTDKIVSEIEKIQRDLDEKNRTLSVNLQDFERLKGEKALIDERLSFNKNNRRERYDKLVALSESIKAEKQLQENAENETVQLQNNINNLEISLKNINENDSDYSFIINLNSQIEENEKNLQETKEKINSAELLLSEKNVEAEFLREKRNNLEQKLAEKRLQFENEKEKAQIEEKNINVITNKEELLQKELSILNNNIVLSKKAKSETQEKTNAARSELDRLNSRIDVINDLSQKHEGYFDSVKKLLNEVNYNEDIKTKIIGTVAELIQIPQEFETAVEIALGNAVQNIIVKNDADAKYIIEYLRKNNIGRITFLPAENLKIRTLSQNEKRFLNSEGIIGITSELISFEKKAQKAVEFLLGRIIIAKNLESALKFAKKIEYTLRIVTLNGDIVSAGGPVTGGSLKKKNTGLLNRRRVSEELSKQREEIKTALNLYEEELFCRKQDEEELIVQKENKEAQRNEFNMQILVAKQNYISAESNIEKNESEIKELVNELNEVIFNYEKIEENTNNLQEELEKYQILSEQIRETIDALTGKLNSLQNRAEEFKEKGDKIHDNIIELTHQKEMKQLETNHMNISISSMENTMREYSKQIEKIAKDISELEDKSKEVTAAIEEMKKNVQITDSQAQNMIETRKQKQHELDSAQKRIIDLNALLNDLNEKKYKTKASNEKAEAVIENAQSKLWDSYSLTYANALKLKKESFNQAEAQKECDKIKNEMREIGSVNPNAIEDYNRVKERYDNINAQKEDLIEAAADLTLIINDLTANMARCFKDKFEQIDQSFRQVFTELFGGGTAALKLQNDMDIMECGIDISAEPPGKKLQNITLLSGGEKALTAIALLFAMLKINPSPVCLLDEIDAPLDDANLFRFSEYLKRLSSENQFIVITHRKPTMSVCDTLYGVAMHEKGVSDLVSVKINESV